MEKFGGSLSEASDVARVSGEENANGTSGPVTTVTSCCTSCCAKASKGTRRSGADAMPKMSPGSRSRYLVRGIVCRPETMKCFEGFWPSWVVIISTI